MDEQIQAAPPQPTPARSSISPMHIVILVLLVLSVAGISAMIWLQVIDRNTQDRLAEAQRVERDLKAELETTKQQLETEKTEPVSPITDEVIFQSEQDKFRIVTTPDCKGVFAVKPGEPSPDYKATASYGIYLTKADSYWSTNPFAVLLTIDTEDVKALQADPKNKDNMDIGRLTIEDSTKIHVSPVRDIRLFGFLGGDGPAAEEFQNVTRTGSCRYVIQAMPTLGE